MISLLRKRQARIGVIVVMWFGGFFTGFLADTVDAANFQVTQRNIQLSSALPSGSGSGTNVTYTVSFNPGQTATVGGVVVDICDDSPLIGSTSCTYPTGFSWGSATPGFSGSITNGGSGWTAAGVAGGGGGNFQVLKLSNATPQSFNTASAVSFNITGVTNPSTANHPFWARIVTFDTSANMANYTTSTTVRAATFAGERDYGGVALSTSQVIAINALVQETLSFCVSGTLLSGATTCSGATASSITLGTGSPATLTTSSTPNTGTAATQISTNAGGGVVVRMLDNNSCGGLSKDGGSTCGIAPAGASAYTFVANAAKFGLNVGSSSFGTGGSGSTTATAPYSSVGQYGMDNTTVGSSVGAAPGSQIMSVSSSGGSLINTPLTFAANASSTTPAGAYTANMELIATGTY